MARGTRGFRLFVLLVALLIGCSRGSAGENPRADERALVVFAAASLRDVFVAMGGEFERTHPGVEVTFNFAGTQELRAQLEHGARADVLASADPRHMQQLVTAKIVESPVPFCRNEPVVIAARHVILESFERLPDLVRLVIGTNEVPIGRYTREILERSRARFGDDFPARVEAKVVSRELNVRQVLAKVALGEADAGIVYRTDALGAAKDVNVVAIPAEVNVIAEYPIARVAGAEHPRLADEWIRMVLSDDGQARLQRAGFLSTRRSGD